MSNLLIGTAFTAMLLVPCLAAFIGFSHSAE
jgi:hypothetical protein